jgi:phage terminase small subunit
MEAAGFLKPDRDLSPAAKRIWNQTVKAMSPGFYAEMDRNLLRMYSRLYVNYEEAQAAVDREGVVIEQDGRTVENPWYKAMLKAAEALARLAVKIKACKSAVETHNAAAQAARIGNPKPPKSARAGLMYGEGDEAPAAGLN